MVVIQCRDVWEKYRIRFVTEDKTVWENFWALRALDLEVSEGEVLGIIGENGSGKSTLLKVLAGMLKPDRGEVRVAGRVTGLLELGAGFQLELTGQENIMLNAGLFGLDPRETQRRYQGIVDFAGLGRFIHAPVKCYSQGMFARLAFSVAIHIDPDVLLIDDILAVGDEAFQAKCARKILEIKERGKTILLVTHDMQMLRRLCRRAILLKEGRLIMDGPCPKVVPLYSRLRGPQESVGTLERGPLRVVFNKGRIFIFWKEEMLTSGAGGHVVFLLGDAWVSSSQAEWDVRLEADDRLIATGTSYQKTWVQRWSAQIMPDGTLLWDISLEADESLGLGEAYVNVLLNKAYRSWVTPERSGPFPDVDAEKKDGQVLSGEAAGMKCLAVEEEPAASLPAVVFEQADDGPLSHPYIINAAYPEPGRILQYRIFPVRGSQEGVARTHVSFAGRLRVGMGRAARRTQDVFESYNLSGQEGALVCRGGRMMLYGKEALLTTGQHVYTSMRVDGTWYSSGAARWEVSKEGSDRLVARGRWEGLALTQVWEFVKNGADSFFWRVSLDIEKAVHLDELNMLCLCRPEYTHWFCDDVRGDFPAAFVSHECDILQKCLPAGTIGVYGPGGALPAVAVSFAPQKGTFAKILNSDFFHKGRILRVIKVPPENERLLPPGRQPCFDLAWHFQEGRRPGPYTVAAGLETGRLRLECAEGRGRLFQDGVPLSKGLALYASLRVDGRWHDSVSSAFWKYERSPQGVLRCAGTWLHVPVRQFWEISAIDRRALAFAVTTEATAALRPERFQTNVMLSESYRQWFSHEAEGVFPEFKDVLDDEWEELWAARNGYDPARAFVGVKAASCLGRLCPSVVFTCAADGKEGALAVVNSDVYHRGRVLRFSHEPPSVWKNGFRLVCRGKIVLQD
ncbi:MAG: ABC transporter ATP-binding protein [Candidatus Omnitrophica bacterium]|nr:ABC transporter ATP-binding protein [Candidatus Omnitrophota bacterium]